MRAGGDEDVRPSGSDACRGDGTRPTRFHTYATSRDRGLRDELINEHHWLAKLVAREFAGRGEPLDDLEQVASLGLLEALDRFDPGRGVSFRSYAAVTMRGELRRHYRDHTWAVKVPRRMKEVALSVWHAAEGMSQRIGRIPSDTDVAEHLGLTREDVAEARAVATNHRLPSVWIHDDEHAEEQEWSAVLAVSEDGFDELEDRVEVQAMLSRLRPREQTIVFLRFYRSMTQVEIADELGLSQVHVSRLLRNALARMG
jgi:RNA polymerase sigma-B factor